MFFWQRVKGMRLEKTPAQFRIWFFLFPMLCAMHIFLIGCFFRHFGPRSTAPELPNIAVEVLFWTQTVFCVGFVVLAKGERRFVVMISLILTLISLYFLFIAQMSLTNVWL